MTIDFLLRTRQAFCLGVILAVSGLQVHADEHDRIRPLIERKCLKCHGGKEINAEVNFKQFASRQAFLDRPELLKNLIGAIDGNSMPPEDEPHLNERERALLLSSLKAMLKEASVSQTAGPLPIRRLNRFQYNYAVKDLFQLRLDVFPLPEKLMTRYSDYLTRSAKELPQRVNVASDSLAPKPGLRGVKAFPKDLRAAHGFDNQANELTLSPLLLDAFLRLSVSIVESPDFNEQNVGIWKDFFLAPSAEVNRKHEVERRLRRFLTLAFRRPVDEETLGRYVSYALRKTEAGMPFTESMKKVASAALSSPKFLYRATTPDPQDDLFERSSNLSFFLWGSGPDEELLKLAECGELTQPMVWNRTIDRMLTDPKIERFLDTFPAQWMQLENVLAATPDPQVNRYFRLDAQRPAGLQMVLEPLLLFDAVFVENRPITELIQPTFTYRSEFLKTWYTSDLKPKPVDTKSILAENRRKDERRRMLQTSIQNRQRALSALRETVRKRVLVAREKNSGKVRPVDLKPYAAWEFDGNLKASIGSLDLKPQGKVRFEDGMVVLNRSYLLSEKLPIELKAKSLEVWCQLDNLDQRGGGLMGIQGPGDFFDTIVIGERQPRHWISGSNGFRRTKDFPESAPETKTGEILHLVMVYSEDGTTWLYRDGQPYGKPFRIGQATFPKDHTSVIFGLRHLPPGGNKFLNVKIDKARLYTRALTAEEVEAGHGTSVPEKDLLAAMTADERARHDSQKQSIAVLEAELKIIPSNRDPAQAKQEAQKGFDDDLRRQMQSRIFDRLELTDPRFGGVITNAAMLSMTSGPDRTHPIARGAWIVEVILNDPPPPPPNDVPPLNEEAGDKNQTIRERFAAHRDKPSCAGCHSRIDPLGFALENFDLVGRWRDKYPNGRNVDAGGILLRKHNFASVVQFKESLCKEDERFAKAFTRHLLRFATSREMTPADVIVIDRIVKNAAKDDFRLKTLIREVIRSDSFLTSKRQHNSKPRESYTPAPVDRN